MADPATSATLRTPEDHWPRWTRAIMVLVAGALCAGGVIGAFYAEQAGSLAVGLIATAVGVILLAVIPGAGADPRER